MDLSVFIFLLFGLQAVCLIIGARSSKGLKTQDEYFLAGKGIRFFPLMMTFLATQFGGGLVLGSAEEAYQFGWSVLCYPLGASLGLIALGLGLGSRLAQKQVSTIAQIFETVYRSPQLKKVASLLSILTLFMILVAQVVSSSKFMVSLGVESKLWFVGFWAMVILYTALGGLKAVVATDVVQAVFFIAVFILSFGFAVGFSETSLSELINLSLNSADFAFNPAKLYGWLLMPFLFMVIEQDMGQRCFAANTPSTVSKATLCAAIATLAVSVIPVFFGVIAKQSGLIVPKGASILMASVMQTTNPIVAAMVGCAILAAIISTADSLINAIGSNLSQDFGLTFEKKNLRFTQALSAAIAILAIFMSFYFNNIVDILIQSYTLSVSCLFVPIFIALFKKQGNTLSAGLAVACGASGVFLSNFLPIELPKEIFGLGLSLTGYLIGEAAMWKRTSLTSGSEVI